MIIIQMMSTKNTNKLIIRFEFYHILTDRYCIQYTSDLRGGNILKTLIQKKNINTIIWLIQNYSSNRSSIFDQSYMYKMFVSRFSSNLHCLNYPRRNSIVMFKTFFLVLQKLYIIIFCLTVWRYEQWHKYPASQ